MITDAQILTARAEVHAAVVALKKAVEEKAATGFAHDKAIERHNAAVKRHEEAKRYLLQLAEQKPAEPPAVKAEPVKPVEAAKPVPITPVKRHDVQASQRR